MACLVFWSQVQQRRLLLVLRPLLLLRLRLQERQFRQCTVR
jgi:hypothetical protein